MNVEKAKISDTQSIYDLIKQFADKGEMLPRALSDIYENIRDFFVVRNNEKEIIGCVSLHVTWDDLAEVKALAVSEMHQSKGFGSSLVKACIEEAQTLDIKNVFCLTYKPIFFEKQGFKKIDKKELPQKVWSECYRCHKFPDCGEEALLYKTN
jgi:amino-acid N-acetyltransferase